MTVESCWHTDQKWCKKKADVMWEESRWGWGSACHFWAVYRDEGSINEEQEIKVPWWQPEWSQVALPIIWFGYSSLKCANCAVVHWKCCFWNIYLHWNASSATSLVLQITIEMWLCFIESTEELLETVNCRWYRENHQHTLNLIENTFQCLMISNLMSTIIYQLHCLLYFHW